MTVEEMRQSSLRVQPIDRRKQIHGREVIIPAGMILVRHNGCLEASTGDRTMDIIWETSRTKEEAHERAKGYWDTYAMNM